jgi:hypothetical protein
MEFSKFHVTKCLSCKLAAVTFVSLCSSLTVRDQVSHPYRTTRKITVLYILIFIFLELIILIVLGDEYKL